MKCSYNTLLQCDSFMPPPPTQADPNKFWQKRFVRISTLPLAFTVRIPSQKINICKMCNSRMILESIAVVRVPCMVRQNPVIWWGGGRTIHIDRCIIGECWRHEVKCLLFCNADVVRSPSTFDKLALKKQMSIIDRTATLPIPRCLLNRKDSMWLSKFGRFSPR